MTLTMADGPVANLPAGFDAYAGYVNDSGIGTTFPAVQVLAAREKAIAFSITTNGSPAQCADVESGAMTSWAGYRYGYCAVSNVNELIAQYGRPPKLWTAHYDPKIGAHICSPACWPGLVTTADGTQWTNGTYDQSLLAADFFGPPPAPPAPPPHLIEGENMTSELVGTQTHVWGIIDNVNYHWWQQQAVANTPPGPWKVEALPMPPAAS